ncbi:MAG TPA: acetamidase/formamidase family protein, partial [Candidatus Acidoferrum sp.]|nr:acetamidase/formamidase family protein [Candidatus Acidoferrum sp.]
MGENKCWPGGDACGGLFGCGSSNNRRYMVEPEAVDGALTPRSRDRLDHLEELNQEALEPYLDSYRVSRRRLVSAGGLLSLLATVVPAGFLNACAGLRNQTTTATPGGRTHVVESTTETVRLGVFDAARPNILEIDSGDTVHYPNTWTHFLNRLQPGVPVGDLARWRVENPGKGPHSIIGPVGVRGARPGDMLSVRFLKLTPLDWGANFNNPGQLKTGALPDEFPDGQVRYLDVDVLRKQARFSASIALPLGPFQGTFGVAPPEDREVVGRLGPGLVSSVPPGQHAGNVDLRELQEGSILYIPVWQPGARIFTGDSHALQGDGEVNLTALETGMRDVRVQVHVHEQPGWAWPFAETETHWIALGLHRDLNQAFRIALSNTLDFLTRRARLSRLDAYSLASLAASFRVTQVVDVNQGVHAMLP